MFGNFAQEMGDSNRAIGQSTNHFFDMWRALLVDLIEEAKSSNRIDREVESDPMSFLIISSIEGALILHKASHDGAVLRKTGRALKSVLSSVRIK
ncbi:TetR family transcriptional regulator C-terminal domain-containing protein [Thermodesulfobacteriota bacterium]